MLYWIFKILPGIRLALINERDLIVWGLLPLHIESSLSLSPLYGLLNRSEFPYEHFGLPVCYRHVLYNFLKIEVYMVTLSIETLRWKPQGRGLNCRWVHWIDLFLPATLLPWVQLSLQQEWVPETSPETWRQPVFGWQPYHLHLPIV